MVDYKIDGKQYNKETREERTQERRFIINVMVHDKELFIKSAEVNPKVSYQKTYVNEGTEQEIIYVHVKK